jgi:hypothetical protein
MTTDQALSLLVYFQGDLAIVETRGREMGDLAKAVAELEQEVGDARELRQIVERLDTEVEARMDEIETIGGAILELHGDLDNQIAEYDYAAVEQSAASLRGLVDMEEVLPTVDAALLLTALRDDSPYLISLCHCRRSRMTTPGNTLASRRRTGTAGSTPTWHGRISAGKRSGATPPGRTPTNGTASGPRTAPMPSGRRSRTAPIGQGPMS